MSKPYNRRQFLNQIAATGAAASLAAAAPPERTAKPMDKVRIGFVGVGGRGRGDLGNLLKMEGVEVRAICDIVEANVVRAQKMVTDAGQVQPEPYSRGETDYKRLCDRDDLDLVFTATPWELHTAVCVEAMKKGKHAASEVPIATTLDECWELVETSEQTGRYCIQMENCNYDRVELMVLNMVRQNLFGDLIHARCGYLHDLRAGKFNDSNGRKLWRLQHSLRRNADLYPTHGLGPVAQCLNINRGNQFDHMVAMSSKSQSLHEYAAAEFGTDSPQAKLDVALGDVVTSLIRTRAGQTVLVTHDTNTPRPYSRDYLIQGTKGIVQKYPEAKIHLDGKSPGHDWEDLIAAYADQFEHPLWRALEERAQGSGHGGMDFVQAYRLIYCLRNGQPLDSDVYDGAALSAVTELSERSIAANSKTVDFPDFTRGNWISRKPLGIVTA
ncbi:MAG: Gfo/Idh/MocA family oxidoreductase [Acidobacteria bacterium]|nr:Gfo/Idh/MocA family oxidoreductase [Acidobacteriota bacterium]